jgi:hypothetical protein
MKTPEHNMRRVEIEVHRDKAKKITGHTVHAYHEPKAASKSGAYIEDTREAVPFNVSDHKKMLAHVAKILGGAGLGEEKSAESD